MKENTEISYKNHRIYLNSFGEYCVLKNESSSMVHSKAGFDTLADAKRFIEIVEEKYNA